MTDFSAPFSAWAGPRHPKMLIIGEAFGEYEERVGQPFVWESGKELWRMLGEAAPELAPEEHSRVEQLTQFDLAWVPQRADWLSAASIGMTNVLNLRPPNNDLQQISAKRADLPSSYPNLTAISKGYYLRPEFLRHLDRLSTEISESSPNLILAMGNTAIWALLQTTNISAIRGNTTSTSKGVKLLPTYHPAGVLRQWSWRPIVVSDLMKAFREAEFPEIRRPERTILVSPTIEEWVNWCDEVLWNPPKWLGCDTETTAGIIDTISFARSSSSAAACMIGPHRVRIGNHYELIYPIRDGKKVVSYWSYDEEQVFWRCNQRLLNSTIVKLGQNFMYDMQYILKMSLSLNSVLEDTMLLHHSLYPEMQKGLGFLGSIYTNEASWKLFRRHQSDTEKRDE